ncbi:MAG: sensor domain-containing diguanylate cyclase [Alphaproteobacteria bacterium]|jgi:diguanylate cyclase (GGDEF)-like protein/PAS domain S-box-containing protein|nr:sensor domain-containing diguanylate cyclase [Alphaproteobacteria bacterium]
MSADQPSGSLENLDENDVPGTASSQEAMLAGYPGAALLVNADGKVSCSNAKGAGLEALIQHDAAPEIKQMVDHARSNGCVAAGSVSLNSAKGEIVLEISVIPGHSADGDVLVMARDMTMERNLRTALVESRQRYKDLVEVSSDFSWETGAEGEFIFVSPKGALGYQVEELIGKKAEDFVLAPEEFSPLPFASPKALDDIEIWMRNKDGSTACVVLSCVPLIAEEDGVEQWKGARGVCRNVTEERENESALARARRREQHLNYIVSTIRDELEPHNMLSAAAAATARALGVTGCRIYRRGQEEPFRIAAEHGNVEGLEGLDNKLAALDSGDKLADMQIGKWRLLATATNYRQRINGAISIWRPFDDEEWDDDHLLLISDVANQLGIANEQISNHERILALSRTDGMTGLLNRRAFYEEDLPRRISRLQRSRETAALFFVDMDNFKRVNDVHGHQAGDDAILSLRDLLMEMSRPGDVIARLGGDEFAMWLDGIAPDVTETRAARLIEASKSLREYSGDDDHPLGISVGVAIYDPDENEPLEDVVARADKAMYEAKNAGKGGFFMAAPPVKTDPGQGVRTIEKPKL